MFCQRMLRIDSLLFLKSLLISSEVYKTENHNINVYHYRKDSFFLKTFFSRFSVAKFKQCADQKKFDKTSFKNTCFSLKIKPFA